jgi:ribosomal protein S1
MSGTDDLDRHFPGHRSDAQAAAWKEVKQRLTVGMPVRGVVVARYPFGAFVDVGVGFPVLLEIIEIEGLTPEKYRAGDWCPKSSQVTARVMGFQDRDRQIHVSQVRPMPGPKPP